jgi:hypothetical protein
VVKGCPIYVWVDFENDLVQMLGSDMYGLVKRKVVEMDMIRYLRIELIGKYGQDESDNLQHVYSHRIQETSKLERCHVLVGELDRYTSYVEERERGMCPRGNVRTIGREIGEWIDGKTNVEYRDYRARNKGETGRYVREVYESEETDGDADSGAFAED